MTGALARDDEVAGKAVDAVQEFVEQFTDESSDEYAVAFDNVKNALTRLNPEEQP